MLFVFGREQIAAFNTLKEELVKSMKLAHFDKREPTKVTTDASPVRLGRSMIQEQSEGPIIVSYAKPQKNM